jgi:BirA family biotin operon repressor/biotin-[acetyl-CoA-carboxylase] ligase
MTHACGPVAEEDRLRLDLLRDGLKNSFFGGNIVYRETLDSTNTLAKEMAGAGAPGGTVVLAEEQTAGRGRRGRSWLSPCKGNLFLSLLLRPALKPDQVFSLTMTLAVAAAEAVRELAHLATGIKWPNDLYVGHSKVAGVLTEFSTKNDAVEYVVLGLGLNVLWSPEADDGISSPATSILAETGERISRNHLLVRILLGFENLLTKVLAGDIADCYRKWNDLSLVLGREVEIESEEGTVLGTAVRIDRDGTLILEDERGQQRRITNGDVSLRYRKKEA